MVDIETAQGIILQQISALHGEEVPLLQGLGRVLRADVHAPRDVPFCDTSAMDGYAFSSHDVRGNYLGVSGFLSAGGAGEASVAPGTAIKIMTGAAVPPGCDTVVPVEDVEALEAGIVLKKPVKRGSHIRRRGEDIRAGERVIAAGTVLRAQEVGLLASFGSSSVTVTRAPNVAVLATGDELIAAGAGFVPGKIFNSNSFSIAAQVLEAGGNPVMLGIARDDAGSTTDMIAAGLQADLLITTGGVSVGDRDFVKEVILALGGDIKFWKVNMKPGKPFAFAMLNGRPIFALPGNPVAAMVAFEQFVRPSLLKMTGHSRLFRPLVKASVTEGFANGSDRPHLVRGCTELRDGKYVVSSTGSQSSARLTSMTSGNALLELAPGCSLAPGDEADVLLLDRGFEMRELCHEPL
jgi:molybdopterin molybdotransferase